MSKDWSAEQYLKFENERTRPSRDLLARIPIEPRIVIDLGCGPGNSTFAIHQRFPQAQITGIDSSQAMIEQAKERYQFSFKVGDINSFSESADLIFSNSVYHWLDNRISVMRRIVENQSSGGVFAFSVPIGLLTEPVHRLMHEVAGYSKFTEFESEEEIYDGLKPLCSSLDMWVTRYCHVLDNHEAVLEWAKGTGLRPYLDPLSKEDGEAFCQEYLKRVKDAFPVMHDGKVCLKFPRLFVVTVKA